MDYLCSQASRYFERPVTPEQVVWSYAGVRPLLDEEPGGSASAVTRDYLLDFDRGGAPLLTVWGGKITTFRKLAEEAADLLVRTFGGRPAWTAGAALPGGDLGGWIGAAERPDTDLRRFDAALARAHPELPKAMRQRWARSYGARVSLILDAGALGAEVAPGLHEAELRYLHDHEWARSADDVLWRRSKLGLHYTPAQRAAVARWWGSAYRSSPGR